MIEDRLLSYGSRPAPLQSFEFEDTTLNTFVIALLTTVLSYQAASLIFDVAFGFKSPDKALACDIHALLLARRSSPLATVASVLRKDWLTRALFKSEIAKVEAIRRDENRIKLWTAAKLLFLLAAVPLINIFAIIITFENGVTLSFREAQFGGIAVGVNEDLTFTETEKLGTFCETPKIRYGRGDSSNVSILLCRNPPFPFRQYRDESFHIGFVRVGILRRYEATVLVSLNGYYEDQSTIVEVTINNTDPFVLRAVVSEANAWILVDLGVNMMSKECGLINPDVIDTTNGTTYDKSITLSLGKRFKCPYPVNKSTEYVHRVVTYLSKRMTLVNDENFDVFSNDDVISIGNHIGSVADEEVAEEGFEYPPFRDLKDYQFLTRKKRSMSIPAIALLTTTLIIVRLVLKTVLNNDVAEGIHRTIKRRVGLLSWESLLRADPEVIHYGENMVEKYPALP